MIIHPSSDSAGEFGLTEAKDSKKPRPEIHSAKAHRCVDKVQAKGHEESSAWAICTASIGKEGVYAKGHGGSARAKRKVRETTELDAEVEAILEANDCHAPAGSPQGGQFCSGGKGGVISRAFRAVKKAVGAPPVTGGAGFSMLTPGTGSRRAHDADKVAFRKNLQKGRNLDDNPLIPDDAEILRRENERIQKFFKKK